MTKFRGGFRGDDLGDKSPPFSESKVLSLIDFLSFIFSKKSYAALETNFTLPKKLSCPSQIRIRSCKFQLLLFVCVTSFFSVFLSVLATTSTLSLFLTTMTLLFANFNLDMNCHSFNQMIFV